MEVAILKVLAKETKPPHRYTDGSLLEAMETAGRDLEDPALREVMKDKGIGTPATRAAIIEHLISIGYAQREGRSIVPTLRGMRLVHLLDDHPLTSPELTGDWEERLLRIEGDASERPRFIADIVTFTTETVERIDALKDTPIERVELGPCPKCGRPVIENRVSFTCWSREDPGCGYRIPRRIAGKELSLEVIRELYETGRTQRPVEGFRNKQGKRFRARLKLVEDEAGRWSLEFDEEWAKAGPRGDGEDGTDAGRGTAEEPRPAGPLPQPIEQALDGAGSPESREAMAMVLSEVLGWPRVEARLPEGDGAIALVRRGTRVGAFGKLTVASAHLRIRLPQEEAATVSSAAHARRRAGPFGVWLSVASSSVSDAITLLRRAYEKAG